MILSQIEKQDLYLVTATTEYISDTSVHYDDLPKKFVQYSLDRMGFDDSFKLYADTVVFQFAVADNAGTTTAGRAIWIDIETVLFDINIISSELGNLVAFEYPGENKSLYMKWRGEWKLVSPIQANIVWLSTPLHEITELAIVDGTIDTGKILHRRVFNENSVTA